MAAVPNGTLGMGEGVLWTQALNPLPFRPADPVETAPLAVRMMSLDLRNSVALASGPVGSLDDLPQGGLRGPSNPRSICGQLKRHISLRTF